MGLCVFCSKTDADCDAFKTKKNIDEFGGCNASVPKLKTAEDFSSIAVSMGLIPYYKHAFLDIVVSVHLSNSVTVVGTVWWN